jgi:hypothetical protein
MDRKQYKLTLVLAVAAIPPLLASCAGSYSASPRVGDTNVRALVASSAEVTEQAMAKRCGWEYVDRRKEISLFQEANLKAAGLTIGDQARIAGDLLMGNTHGSERYIKALGLSFADEREARNEFLQAVGKTSAEIRQSDNATVGIFGSFYDSYLQVLAGLILAGGCK